MIIYTAHSSPRLSFALNHIFKDYFGVAYLLTQDTAVFRESPDHKINYSHQTFDSGMDILPEGLLSETDIRETKPEITLRQQMPVLFKQEQGAPGFDIFAAVFWFLSRYEEYQPFTPDAHGRFPASESLAFQQEVLHRPLVDEWLENFRELLQSTFPDIALRERSFKAYTTIDVDSPWCYKNKGVARNVAGLLRDVGYARFDAVKLRMKVLGNTIPDPWFHFDWINELHHDSDVGLHYFMHVGDYSRYDKTVSYKSKAFRTFVKNLHQHTHMGLHPSYLASDNISVFQKELDRLADITGSVISKSRQHFLVFEMGKYYRQLKALGIRDDYSMGFADKSGFRAGTSNPFYFFDLRHNQETNLRIHPFVIMDRTLNTYEQKSNELALETMKEFAEKIKKVNGTFVSLWHNESLSSKFEWKGWKHVFVELKNYLETVK